MRVHHVLSRSYANGPGCRWVLFLQGCTLGCPNCFNPTTHPLHGGSTRTIDDLLQEILQVKDMIEGVTVSGGEPLLQIKELVDLTSKIRVSSTLSVIIFTGYTWQEVQGLPSKDVLLTNLDLLIAGRYQHGTRIARGLMGSQNKTLHFLSDRYKIEDLIQTPTTEIIINTLGEIEFSGIDPINL